MTRGRSLNLLAGLALVALSGWLYSFAADIFSRSRLHPQRPAFNVYSSSRVEHLELRHSFVFWLVLGTTTLALGLLAVAFNYHQSRPFRRKQGA